MVLIIVTEIRRRKVEVGVMADGCWYVLSLYFLCDVW